MRILMRRIAESWPFLAPSATVLSAPLAAVRVALVSVQIKKLGITLTRFIGKFRQIKRAEKGADDLVSVSFPSALQIACYIAAKEYPGGIRAVADRYGLDPKMFQQKIDPGVPGVMNLKEFEAVLQATKSQLIIDVLADLLRNE